MYNKIIFVLGSIGIVLCFSNISLGQDVNFVPDSVKKTTPYKNSFLIAPLISNTPETNWAFALASVYVFKTQEKDSTLRTSTIPIGVAYTLRKQTIVAINGNIFFPREKYVWKFEVNFSDFIDKFWGIGNGTQKNQEEGYSFVQIFLSTQVDKKILGGAFAGLGWDYQHVITTSYTKNGWFDKDNVIGKDPYQISGPTFYFTYDTRNHSYIPNRGNYFKLKYGGFFPFTGSDYRFDQVEIDYRTFYKIYKKWVIAAQVYQYYTFGDTPFRSLAQMGGGYTMRGYYAGRFRDKLFITSQAELRYPIYWRFSGTIFAGVGEVARKFEDFRFEKIKHSIGAGLRFNLLPKDNLNLRFDVAMGNYGNINFYVLLAESF